MKPKLLCILGLSGSGKTSIESYLTEMKEFRKVVSCATRPMREGEVDEYDYHFISEEQFDIEYNDGQYVEIGGKYGGRYAVRYNEILPNGINILVTAKDGLDELFYSELYDIIAIWVDCDLEERFKRISKRNTTKYALERIERDGFRREQEIKTCKYVIDSTSISEFEMVNKVLDILKENKWIGVKK